MQHYWTLYLDLFPNEFTLLLYGYGIFLIFWPIFLLMEKLTPVNEHTPGSNYLFNWKIVLTNLFLSPLFSLLVVLLVMTVKKWVGLPGLQYPMVELSLGIAPVDFLLNALLLILIACFLGDFSYYWWHRWQHKVPALWELHKLHHSDEHLNATTIYRSHFLELAGQGLVRGLSIGILFDLSSLPQTLMVIVFAELFKLIWDFFIHANVRIDWLHRLLPFFTTPQFHWIHHSRLEQHRDTNYAIWLPLFDIVFGSYYHPAVEEYPPTGLSTGEKHESVWKAQTEPFVAWWRMLRGKSSTLSVTDKSSEI